MDTVGSCLQGATEGSLERSLPPCLPVSHPSHSCFSSMSGGQDSYRNPRSASGSPCRIRRWDSGSLVTLRYFLFLFLILLLSSSNSKEMNDLERANESEIGKAKKKKKKSNFAKLLFKGALWDQEQSSAIHHGAELWGWGGGRWPRCVWTALGPVRE